jgi:hypothetical protein
MGDTCLPDTVIQVSYDTVPAHWSWRIEHWSYGGHAHDNYLTMRPKMVSSLVTFGYDEQEAGH